MVISSVYPKQKKSDYAYNSRRKKISKICDSHQACIHQSIFIEGKHYIFYPETFLCNNSHQNVAKHTCIVNEIVF